MVPRCGYVAVCVPLPAYVSLQARQHLYDWINRRVTDFRASTLLSVDRNLSLYMPLARDYYDTRTRDTSSDAGAFNVVTGVHTMLNSDSYAACAPAKCSAWVHVLDFRYVEPAEYILYSHEYRTAEGISFRFQWYIFLCYRRFSIITTTFRCPFPWITGRAKLIEADCRSDKGGWAEYTSNTVIFSQSGTRRPVHWEITCKVNKRFRAYWHRSFIFAIVWSNDRLRTVHECRSL